MTSCGARSTYQRGCRCLRCRVANAKYQQELRARGGRRGLVPAAAAAEHLERMAALGVGYRQAARLSGVGITEIRAVRRGTQVMIRPETAGRLLAIRAVLAPGQRVNAWPTWRLIHSLQSEGFTLGALARTLGLQSGQLQLDHHRVTVRNALLVRHFHAKVTAEGPEVTA